jgi:hypothetical protein
MSVEHPRSNGTLKLLRESSRLHPGPWLEPCRDHQLCPLAAVRACALSVEQIDRHVRDLVTDHLAQQLFRLVENGRVDSNYSGCGMAATEGGAETFARFEMDSFREVGKRPGPSPFS